MPIMNWTHPDNLAHDYPLFRVGPFGCGLCGQNQSTNPKSGELKYSINGNSRLSSEQQKQYEDQGFIIIKNLIPKHDIEKYSKRFHDIASRRVPTPPGLVVQKEVKAAKESQSENSVYKLWDLFNDDQLFDYCLHPRLLPYVEAFCGPNVMAVHTMLINKPPDSGANSSRHPLHQDMHLVPITPADRIVVAWTALEAVNRANGCLSVIAGTHKGPLLEHDYPRWEGGFNALYQGVKDMTGSENRVHIEADAGDCLLFHPNLIHGSGANRSQGYRKAITCHFAASDYDYVDVKDTIHESAANEVLAMLDRKFGHKFDKYYVWLCSDRLVQ
ncbi:unnamed protein product [Medioppia subpectinata]|uniref:phytanoyl-CoA dioxygenase n=1 Tax=Medioppia subpectinata TaxID=1979941 RepID=A0A7R9KL22_9ACAR|nr:unnamed protein product [Medioppia subpectinata]CAG2105568.1 unnamed protein product [Medioppia subpectinata]